MQPQPGDAWAPGGPAEKARGRERSTSSGSGAPPGSVPPFSQGAPGPHGHPMMPPPWVGPHPPPPWMPPPHLFAGGPGPWGPPPQFPPHQQRPPPQREQLYRHSNNYHPVPPGVVPGMPKRQVKQKKAEFKAQISEHRGALKIAGAGWGVPSPAAWRGRSTGGGCCNAPIGYHTPSQQPNTRTPMHHTCSGRSTRAGPAAAVGRL
jgi:hypothetical protein